MNAGEPAKFWWLRRAKYVAIFLRELSSVFILAYVLLYLEILSQVRSGGTGLVAQLATPPFIVLSLTMLLFSLYHSITWFLLLPKIQPIKLGTFVLRGRNAFLVNLGILGVASLVVASLVFGIEVPLLTR